MMLSARNAGEALVRRRSTVDTVFKFLFEFLGQFFGSLWSIISGLFMGIGGAFDFPSYINIINAYTTELGGLAWGIAILAIVLLVAVLVLAVWLIVVAVKNSELTEEQKKKAIEEYLASIGKTDSDSVQTPADSKSDNK